MSIESEIREKAKEREDSYLSSVERLTKLVIEKGDLFDNQALSNIISYPTSYSIAEREVWCLLYAMNDLNYQGDARQVIFGIIPYLANFSDSQTFRMSRNYCVNPERLSSMTKEEFEEYTMPRPIEGNYATWYDANKDCYQNIIKGIMK